MWPFRPCHVLNFSQSEIGNFSLGHDSLISIFKLLVPFFCCTCALDSARVLCLKILGSDAQNDISPLMASLSIGNGGQTWFLCRFEASH